MSTLGKAIAITSEAFKNKKDRGGKPYILHCLRVMNGVAELGEEAMIVAVLHDLLEDTAWTVDLLIKEGFAVNTITRIVLLTHESGDDYMEYVKALARDPIAKAVKKADLIDNSDITRLKGLSSKDFDRLQKYFTAYEYLKS